MNASTKRMGLGAASLLIAAAAWLPAAHRLFQPRLADYTGAGLPPQVRALAAQQLQLWTDPASKSNEVQRMRSSNAEWDFMARTYFVLALANMALRHPEEKPAYLAVMDAILEETLRLEKEHGVYYFLMDYARASPFKSTGARSLFQDGEIALMLGARQWLEEKAEYKAILRERIGLIVAAMEEGPVLCGESYPDECWMFCNCVALAAVKISDALERQDHAEFFNRWIAAAKAQLTDRETGLLISSFSFDGSPGDGPEGSSIWMAAHCLQLIDPAFAEDQYRRAKTELAGHFLGFGYAREWPRTWEGAMDVDSGPIIPLFKISAGSSGLAFVGASAFGDSDYLQALLTTLEYGGFPIRRGGRLRYAASNQVGDAVLLYALALGPLWKDIQTRREDRP